MYYLNKKVNLNNKHELTSVGLFSHDQHVTHYHLLSTPAVVATGSVLALCPVKSVHSPAYHEMTTLASPINTLVNQSLSVKEQFIKYSVNHQNNAARPTVSM